jgi:hypothetical protein
MTPQYCTCGFTEVEGADETISDHFFEVFAPDDGKAADGKVHLEGEASLFCMCGYGGSAKELDAHFLAVFTPDDHIGRDGSQHQAVASQVAGDTEPPLWHRTVVCADLVGPATESVTRTRA